MRYPDAVELPGHDSLGGERDRAASSARHVQSSHDVGGTPIATESFKILPDPRIKATLADWEEQSRVALQIRDRFSEANDAVKEIRRIKAELADRRSKMPAAQQARSRRLAGGFTTALSQVEDSLYQTKNRSGQDPLNYPIRLNNRIGALMGVVSSSDGKPTQQSYEVNTRADEGAERADQQASNDPEYGSSEDQRDAESSGAEGD